MNFSKYLMSAIAVTSFLMGAISPSFAASKMAQPHSDVTLDIAKAPELNVPGMEMMAEKPVGVKVARRGRRVVGAIIALGAAAIIANEVRRSERRRRYRRHHYRRPSRFRRCDRLLRRCDNGYRRACRRFYRHCDF